MEKNIFYILKRSNTQVKRLFYLAAFYYYLTSHKYLVKKKPLSLNVFLRQKKPHNHIQTNDIDDYY
jgi:hypothetical protein